MKRVDFHTLVLAIVAILIVLLVIFGVRELSGYSVKGLDQNRCFVTPESGPCTDGKEKYYYDVDSNSCKSFVWGGCQGKVPFDNLEECKKICEIPEP